MSRSITIAGTERAGVLRLESFSFQESAYRGEVGQGGFDIDSDLGAIEVPAWKDVVADDTDGGTFYWGQTIDRGVGRGPFSEDSSAQWDVQVVDMNTIMDDILLRGSEWNRPEETDVERMQALVAFLNSEGYNIDDTYLLTTAAEDMDAQDYRKQGVYPRSVADECAENSGKNWYLFYDPDIDQLGIWYGRETSSLRTSAYGISTVLDDIDDYGVTWPAEWVEESGLTLDPSRVYSAVQVVYGPTPNSVYVDRPATEAAFKRREAILFDASVKTATKATKLAEHYLDFAETEDKTITVAVTLPTTHVNAFLVGQRVALRAPHLGYDSPTYMRCRTKTVEPAGPDAKAPDRYRVTLLLKPQVKTTNFGGRPKNDVPGQGDNPDESGGGGTPADLDYGTAVGLTHRQVKRQDPADGTGVFDTYLSSPINDGLVTSAVYNNVPYTDGDFPCPIGGGSWKGWSDETAWWDFTAPADGDYLGMVVTVDSTLTSLTGYGGGYDICIASKLAIDGTVDDGVPIAGGLLGTIQTLYLPRSLINWGGDAALVLKPRWRCVRGVQFCNVASSFISPTDDGRAASGAYETWDISEMKTVFFASGTTGLAVDVAGLGDVDGVNTVFELMAWDGTGQPSFSINGLDQSTVDVTFDTGAKTATLAYPPPPFAIVLWSYNVSA